MGQSGHDQIAIVSHDRGSILIAAVRSDLVGWAVPISRFNVLLMHDRRPFDEDPTIPMSRDVVRSMNIMITIHEDLDPLRAISDGSGSLSNASTCHQVSRQS